MPVMLFRETAQASSSVLVALLRFSNQQTRSHALNKLLRYLFFWIFLGFFPKKNKIVYH